MVAWGFHQWRFQSDSQQLIKHRNKLMPRKPGTTRNSKIISKRLIYFSNWTILQTAGSFTSLEKQNRISFAASNDFFFRFLYLYICVPFYVLFINQFHNHVQCQKGKKVEDCSTAQSVVVYVLYSMYIDKKQTLVRFFCRQPFCMPSLVVHWPVKICHFSYCTWLLQELVYSARVASLSVGIFTGAFWVPTFRSGGRGYFRVARNRPLYLQYSGTKQIVPCMSNQSYSHI